MLSLCMYLYIYINTHIYILYMYTQSDKANNYINFIRNQDNEPNLRNENIPKQFSTNANLSFELEIVL